MQKPFSGTVNLTDDTGSTVTGLSAPGANVQWVVTSIMVTNASATTATKVSIRDGTTAKIVGQAESSGGGFSYTNTAGLFEATANAAITAICATTGANVDVNVTAFKKRTS